MFRLETVRVVNPNDPKGGFMIVNKSDYEGNKKSDDNKEGLELHETDPTHPGASDEDKGAARAEAEALDAPKPRNTSGTFDEPSPMDIRYPNKDGTEFENNHGAFMGTSAAELRDANDMEQKPGGVDDTQLQAVKKEDEARKEREAAGARSQQDKPKLARRLPQQTQAKRTSR